MRKSNVGMTMRKGFASAIQQLALRYNYNADIVAITDTRKSNVGMTMRKGFASAIHIFCIYVGLIDDWVHRPSNRRAANVVAAHIYLYYDSKHAIFEIEQFCLRCTEKAPLKKIGRAQERLNSSSNVENTTNVFGQTEMECSRELLN